MTVDVVMVSLTTNEQLFRMTQLAIDSLRQSEQEIEFNIILIESNGDWHQNYTGVNQMILEHEEFNYNKFLADGVKHCTHDWVILCNNDLLFGRGFMSEIVRVFQSVFGRIKSFGTWNEATHKLWFRESKKIYYGYRVPAEVTGWCIVARREIFEQIGFAEEVNQRVRFWYSDNIYADLLQKHNIPHALCRYARVTHLKHGTIKQQSAEVITGFIKDIENFEGGNPAVKEMIRNGTILKA